MSATTTKRFTKRSEVSSNLSAVDTMGNEFRVPDFTITDILNAIPKHCFKRDLLKSLGFVARDIFFIVLFRVAAHWAIPQFENSYVRFVLWSLYTIVQSFPMVGLWILAHECGHSAFSEHNWINDTVGWVLHSYTGNPYFSWKFSHRKHHKATGHIDKDMVFIPPRRDAFLEKKGVSKLSELTEESPITNVLTLIIQQVVGFQTYLAIDATGQKHPQLEGEGHWYKQFYASHFNPNACIFDKGDFWFVILSDIGILTQIYVCYQWIQNFGVFNWVVDWFVPYLLVNHWIVFLTYLQHTDVSLAHYEDSEWTFARGAGATIDREFGFVGWFFFHDIIETHVCHHYFSRIPFYNAREATESIKKVIGDHYSYSDENMLKTLWKSIRMCEFVEGDNGVLMYRNRNNLGAKPAPEK